MPIRPENRWLYPIDWPQISDHIRFGRAGGRCEQCGRPHKRRVAHLGDGRWWDVEARAWRSGRGRKVKVATGFSLDLVRTTYVVLGGVCGRGRNPTLRIWASDIPRLD